MTHIKKKIRWNFQDPVRLLKWKGVHTVCEESRCPNRHECSSEGIATYLIGGRICTRACRFCHIETGKPVLKLKEIMQEEEESIILSVNELKNRYVVITSVARDDSEAELAEHFANITSRLNRMRVGVELLIPDFHLREECFNKIASARPLVLAHNIETVRELSRKIRPQADYERSLKLYDFFHRNHPGLILKAGIMVGLGEKIDQVKQTLLDLKEHNVEVVTIGQYLQPSFKQTVMVDQITQENFRKLEALCSEIGFSGYEVGPFVRSSYMASRTMQRVKALKMTA